MLQTCCHLPSREIKWIPRRFHLTSSSLYGMPFGNKRLLTSFFCLSHPTWPPFSFVIWNSGIACKPYFFLGFCCVFLRVLYTSFSTSAPHQTSWFFSSFCWLYCMAAGLTYFAVGAWGINDYLTTKFSISRRVLPGYNNLIDRVYEFLSLTLSSSLLFVGIFNC